MVTELGPPVLESTTRISKFYVPTDSEQKLATHSIQSGIVMIGKLQPHSLCPTANKKSIKLTFYIPIHRVLE